VEIIGKPGIEFDPQGVDLREQDREEGGGSSSTARRRGRRSLSGNSREFISRTTNSAPKRQRELQAGKTIIGRLAQVGVLVTPSSSLPTEEWTVNSGAFSSSKMASGMSSSTMSLVGPEGGKCTPSTGLAGTSPLYVCDVYVNGKHNGGDFCVQDMGGTATSILPLNFENLDIGVEGDLNPVWQFPFDLDMNKDWYGSLDQLSSGRAYFTKSSSTRTGRLFMYFFEFDGSCDDYFKSTELAPRPIVNHGDTPAISRLPLVSSPKSSTLDRSLE
jgi:hypothetical protein